jgi:hypothetical protein
MYELDARVPPGAGAGWRGAAHDEAAGRTGRVRYWSAGVLSQQSQGFHSGCQLRRVGDNAGGVARGPSASGLAACGSGGPAGFYLYVNTYTSVDHGYFTPWR